MGWRWQDEPAACARRSVGRQRLRLLLCSRAIQRLPLDQTEYRRAGSAEPLHYDTRRFRHGRGCGDRPCRLFRLAGEPVPRAAAWNFMVPVGKQRMARVGDPGGAVRRWQVCANRHGLPLRPRRPASDQRGPGAIQSGATSRYQPADRLGRSRPAPGTFPGPGDPPRSCRGHHCA